MKSKISCLVASFAFSAAVLPLTPVFADGAAIDYRIVVRTATNDSWTDGHGTDNFIDITMYGENGQTKKLELQGNHEAGQTDSFTYATKDIGVINKITLDVSGDLADKWTPLDIKILRAAETDAVEGADGWSEFFINKELGYDPVVFSASKLVPKSITITDTGEVIKSSLIETYVNYADNLSSPGAQTLMQFAEDWRHVKSIGVSTSQVTSFGNSLTLSYEYENETPAGKHKFGVAASQSWSRALGSVQSKSDSHWEGSKFDWSFEVPRNTFLIRKVAFEIPIVEQRLEDSLGQSFAVRSLGEKIAPLPSAGSILAIPSIDRADKVDPVSLSDLENDYVRHMRIADIQSIYRDHMDRFLEEGWVVEDFKLKKGTTGRNALQVVYGREGKRTGRYINTKDKIWVTQGFKPGNGFAFEEVARDDWTIYLHDASRNVRIKLNLHTKKVMYLDGSSPNYRQINQIFSAAG